MFEIDFLKFLVEQKIYGALSEGIKKNTKLSDSEVDSFLKDRIEKHGDSMNQLFKKHVQTYQDMKGQNLKKDEIDQKLDEMVNNFINQKKKQG